MKTPIVIIGSTIFVGILISLVPNQTETLASADPEPVSVSQPVITETRKISRAKPQAPCSDHLATVLWNAGFKGKQLAMAWAIVMRESNGQNIVPGNSHFNGEDYGVFQLNKPTWGNEPWWDDDAVVTVQGNARMAYELIQERGFGAWGLTNDGEFDFSSYGGWSDWQKENWIVRPYLKYLTQYWETCNGWNHQETN